MENDMSRPIPTFCFADEPQFRTTCGRQEMANRLQSYRCRENGNARRYSVKRVRSGLYHVQLRYTGSPVAVIETR